MLSEYADDPIKYEAHFWYALGHLEEAAREVWAKYPTLAKIIRDIRLKLMADDTFWPVFDDVIKLACRLSDEEVKEKNHNRRNEK